MRDEDGFMFCFSSEGVWEDGFGLSVRAYFMVDIPLEHSKSGIRLRWDGMATAQELG